MKITVPLACALFAASPALAVQYDFTVLPTGFGAAAINNVGEIAGSAPQPGNPQLVVPATDTGGVITLLNLSFPPSAGTVLTGINDAGDLVGIDAGRTPFTVFGGVVGGVAAPGGTSAGTQAYGLNNARQVVGTALAATGQTSVLEGYVSSGSTFAVVAVPGATPDLPTFTQAKGINNAGAVVGSFGPGPGLPQQQGFLDQGGTFTTIAVPGSAQTNPLAINDGGEIAGQYNAAGGATRGFTDIGGVFSDVTGPDGSAFLPVGLNNAGQLVGTFGGTGLSYLATPQAAIAAVPEPGTAALLGGVVALGVAGRRRAWHDNRRPDPAAVRARSA